MKTVLSLAALAALAAAAMPVAAQSYPSRPVRILVGFAPLKPAEFVVIKLQQMTGQIET